jgi:hypothetical protein
VIENEPVDPERIRRILDDLIRQRQQMRNGEVEPGLLEANRLSIVYWQWQLSRTRGHGPGSAGVDDAAA